VVVRISKGRFGADKADDVQRLLQESESSLRPAITALPGLVRYYVGLDRSTGTMTNTSVWDSREHAMAMASLKAMLELRSVFEVAGVEFESITNHEVLWEL
jgi:hypothetical protein